MIRVNGQGWPIVRQIAICKFFVKTLITRKVAIQLNKGSNTICAIACYDRNIEKRHLRHDRVDVNVEDFSVRLAFLLDENPGISHSSTRMPFQKQSLHPKLELQTYDD